ncbi:cyclic nucleotide-binding domain-containing protein [Falsirhodobacter algicola]|uniref:Cyclic nucleotide-binding domain-containing protein n=1 Tax=Falsirhodobacter algicola TaxID=2692330 RepID=A0A8J8MQW1_9RHOB|nr:cation:proton antiporter [Falsirhodobacter algicola]QUS34789.1 cyclic nucleotide-binding domain-containing protein [Falsirhodobacter algicola]
MDITLLVGITAILFLVISISEPLAARLRLPYSVVLAVVGAALGTLALGLQTTDAGLGPELREALALPIKSSVFLVVFLPTLLFEVSLGLNVRRMVDDWVPILVMAVLAVLAATLVIGFALHPFSSMPLVGCLLLGAIVSTTDPSAVVSIFRNVAAPQRLMRIVEGESLLNDAAAIALFGFFLTYVMAGVPNPTLLSGFGTFPWLLGGGLLVGLVLGRIAVEGMRVMPGHPLAQISVSVALPYITFIAAEEMGVSGVVAVVGAGLLLNIAGPSRLAPATWAQLRELWGLLAHWAGALIFVLAALLIPRLLTDVRPHDLFLILVVAAAAFASRALILWGVIPALRAVKLSPRVEPAYRAAILWGGLRGAVTLALALAVTENALVPGNIKREIGILATGYVLFTLFVQGTTLRRVIRRLGLARLSPLDLALSNQVIAVALQNVREEVADSVREHELSRDIVRSEAKRFGQRLENAVQRAEQTNEISDRERITLGLVALAVREREEILDSFREQLITTRLVERMLSDAEYLIERTRQQGRDGYRAASRRSITAGPVARAAVIVHNRLGLSGPLANLVADRFDILLNQRTILRHLHLYIDQKVRRLYGRRVSDLLHELLKRREEEAERALESLHLQYPSYTEEMERRYIRRAALRMEERQYKALLDDGLIGPELHATLCGAIARERTKSLTRPRLDLAVHKDELIRQFPLFSGMDEDQRRALAKAMYTFYAQPGEILVRRGETARRVFFIASGAVENDIAGEKRRLGRGEMFGQLSMLMRKTRAAQVTSIAYSTLLALDEARFRDLLARNRELQQAVVDSARARGVQLDLDLLPAAGG